MKNLVLIAGAVLVFAQASAQYPSVRKTVKSTSIEKEYGEYLQLFEKYGSLKSNYLTPFLIDDSNKYMMYSAPDSIAYFSAPDSIAYFSTLDSIDFSKRYDYFNAPVSLEEFAERMGESTTGEDEIPFLFPSFTKKEKTFEFLYSKDNDKSFYFANNASLQVNNSGVIVQSELVSAYLGFTRVSFGTTVSNSNEEDSEEENTTTPTDKTQAFQRLLTGGGNTYLKFELPLFLGMDQKNLFLAYLNASGRISLDISEFSNDVDTTTGNGSLNSNLYVSLATDENEFDFFFNVNYGYFFGHKDFYERLEIEDQKAFWFGELTAGVTIQQNLRFAVTFNTFSSEENLRSGNVLVGAQILSGIFEKNEKP